MDPAIYEAGLTVAAGFFMLSFVLTIYRIVVGPNSIDRLLGLDATVSMIQCSMATYICWSLDTTVSNFMMVIALLGFISSVSVARFRKRDGA
ncbi:putative monovalent cation/H+ antiporter subunit F [Corynebacterium deserti GIMN1.010]|uniref:Putative monovalent cation/H+ antiporter subunit F n=1 Tax=Corynebacterium deserti GIMN1.010 TaxID=931089 RepID=A0A0M3QA36_9CORY|nr:monovalent cation/H+ antiporter complex subunit F [Corynebacterium deserti]ALC06809.1 putative monovalent cation/H+ antiporter subunit F [Corynebacterium deserti GIMN1.010]